jgi:hypothetical protein
MYDTSLQQSIVFRILLTAIGLTPGGSSTVQYSTHLHTNNIEQYNKTEYTEWNVHNNKNT